MEFEKNKLHTIFINYIIFLTRLDIFADIILTNLKKIKLTNSCLLSLSFNNIIINRKYQVFALFYYIINNVQIYNHISASEFQKLIVNIN